jgi:hypothetical protein
LVVALTFGSVAWVATARIALARSRQCFGSLMSLRRRLVIDSLLCHGAIIHECLTSDRSFISCKCAGETTVPAAGKVLMPQLGEDANTILKHMKALGTDVGDYVLIDVFVTLLDNNEHRAVSALDELITLKLVVGTARKEAFAMTIAGSRYPTTV